MRQMYASTQKPPPSENKPPPPQKESAGNSRPKTGSIFDELGIDEEKALIGILLYILYKNGADIKLLLALGYLLM